MHITLNSVFEVNFFQAIVCKIFESIIKVTFSKMLMDGECFSQLDCFTPRKHYATRRKMKDVSKGEKTKNTQPIYFRKTQEHSEHN